VATMVTNTVSFASRSTLQVKPQVSLILPCRNEQAALPSCLAEAEAALRALGRPFELIVVDNGSTDRSAAILAEAQRRFPELAVVAEPRPGYGSAYRAGLAAARGDALVLADCDGTYPLGDVGRFVAAIEAGADMVVGNRFLGGIPAGAMPWTHRYVGNPVLSFLVRAFFGVRIGDVHCGARAISRAALARLNLCTVGMEFASEMVVKAAKQGLRIGELPVRYRPRLGDSKLRTVADGWRHLRFALLYSPLFLFLAPGLALAAAGAATFAAMLATTPTVFGVPMVVHPVFLAALLVVVGYQLVLFAGFARVYAVNHLGDRDPLIERLYRHLTLERALAAGVLVAAAGAAVYLKVFAGWVASGFGELDAVKVSTLGLTLITVGAQTAFSAFVFSIIGIEERR
jgi:hypothetical protein